MSNLKMIGLAALYFVTGMIANRGGQHVLMQKFQTCYEAKLETARSLDDVFEAQRACMPGKVAIKIFFW